MTTAARLIAKENARKSTALNNLIFATLTSIKPTAMLIPIIFKRYRAAPWPGNKIPAIREKNTICFI